MYFNYSRFFVVIFLFSISFSQNYDIDDQVTIEHQSLQFDVCYGYEHNVITSRNCEQFETQGACIDSSEGEPFDDLNMDGLYTYAEPFEDLEEPYEDLNGNEQWDDGEPYEDLNENGSFDGLNGRWDEGEPYEDLNENGSYDEFDEPYDDLYDNNQWDASFDCRWENNECIDLPLLSLGDLNGYTNDSGIFYVIMIDMAASW